MGKKKMKREATIKAYEKKIKEMDDELTSLRHERDDWSEEKQSRYFELMQLKIFTLSKMNKDREKLNEPSFFNKQNMERAAFLLSPLIYAGFYGINQANKKAHKINKEHNQEKQYQQLRKTL